MPLSPDLHLAHCRLDGLSGHEAGRALLEKLYFQATGDPLPAIRRTQRGKPYFSDSPWHFSISHTRRHAFCVLSRHPVGLDAEEMDRKIDLRLGEKILSPSEKARLSPAPDAQTLLKLWVLKEAAAKHTGQGLTGYPNTTDFSPDDPRIREIDGCYVAIIETTTPQEDHYAL